ncbi:50S ribosomal protein L1 [Buchnera aphidicola (Thelaxes suberi)]|uniref:50S ribosomal protein L1 n=1 Tax=Buchnera aphidicola TaxID=9 RepID=UPI003463A116
MNTRIKKINRIKETIDVNKLYSFTEAIELIKSTAIAKFNESIDVSIHLGIDPKKTEQNVKGTVILPHGIGRNIVVAVFAKDAVHVQQAQDAGAEFIGMEDLVQKIKKDNLTIDIVIATPDTMKLVSTIGSFLGPRGLMPNPKLGTITSNVFQSVKNAKSGQIQYKNNKNGIINTIIGKTNFHKNQLKDNLISFLTSLKKNKPTNSKGNFLKKIILSSTMGISLPLDQSYLL